MNKKLMLWGIILFLTGCQFFQQDAEKQTTVTQETTSVTSNPPQDYSFLNETLDQETDYPKLTLPKDAPQDLNQAMTLYYQENFDTQQKEFNKKPLTTSQVKDLHKAINAEEDLKKLKISIDQAQFTFGSDTLYVPRIIVPMNYPQAEKLCQENDSQIINTALSELGNRLVLVAYYDQANQELHPMHLVNSTESLYYNDALAQSDQ